MPNCKFNQPNPSEKGTPDTQGKFSEFLEQLASGSSQEEILRQITRALENRPGVKRATVLLETNRGAIRTGGEETEGLTLKERVALLEREVILDALYRHRGTIRSAARELGITERMVRYKLEKLEIDHEAVFKKGRRKRLPKN